MRLFTKKNHIARLALLPLAASLSGCLLQQQARPDPEPTAAMSLPTAAEARQSNPLAGLDEGEAAVCTMAEDMWDRLRAGYQLPAVDHPKVESGTLWYARHQSYLDRIAERARPYMHLVAEALEERDMPMEIALLPVVESAFQPFAYSHGRAAGLWQFVPGTGRRFGLRQTWWYDGRRDVAQSTRAAVEYLEYLHGYFDGDWLLALAAYNAGEGTVRRAIRRNEKAGRPTDFFSLDLPRETRGYVPKLLAISSIVADPAKHGVTLKDLPNDVYLAEVDVGSQIDLDLVAELAELSIEEVYRYNPGFNRWATDPDGPHTLLLPRERADAFQQRLAEHPADKRMSWVRHRIRSGENLIAIASRYSTTASLIREVNDIRGNLIRAGDSLVIPVARTDLGRYKLSAGQRLAQLQGKERKGQKIEYGVRKGDTLWEIARRHRVQVRTLASWNGMAPRDTLRPGQTLVIWTSDATKVSASGPAKFDHPFQKEARQRIGYTVKRGDSLFLISQRFRVSVANLKRWNNLDGQRYLQPGQRLTLYVDVTRQADSI